LLQATMATAASASAEAHKIILYLFVLIVKRLICVLVGQFVEVHLGKM